MASPGPTGPHRSARSFICREQAVFQRCFARNRPDCRIGAEDSFGDFLSGPVCGAILLTVLPELLRGIGDLRLIVYGVTLTLVVLFMPGGIAQAVRLLRARLFRALPRAAAGAAR